MSIEQHENYKYKSKKRSIVKVWTDGSASIQDGRGGWGFVATFQGRRIERFAGYKEDATNNEMELAAIYAALKIIKLTPDKLQIHTDSKYSLNAICHWVKGWKRNGWTTAAGKPVQNRKMIEACHREFLRHKKVRQISIIHVRGHSGITENERADFLAGNARLTGKDNLTAELILPSRDGKPAPKSTGLLPVVKRSSPPTA